METPEAQPVQMPVRNVSSTNKKLWPYIVGAFVVVILGVVGAWLISSKLMVRKTAGAAPGVKVTSTQAGELDPNTKYDNATGDLKDGGIAGQGTHHIERDGGPSHFVYLTSSVIDLSSFVGKKVQVWGQTLASKKAPWLMDVAKIQVVQ
jgi:hypothetical protein